MNSAGSLTCAITGARGYIGASLKKYLETKGLHVISLIRNASPSQSDEIEFSLEKGMDAKKLLGIDILIHCAYDFQSRDRKSIWRSNVEGSLALFRAADQMKVKKIILISTMSAFESCKSMYGQTKMAVEKDVRNRNALILRPGLVYGNNSRSIVGAMTKTVSSSPFVPVIGSGDYVLYLTHIDDLCELVYRGCMDQLNGITGPILAASDHGYAFRDIVKLLATSQNKHPFLISIPAFLIWGLIRFLEILGLKPNFRSDSVTSLIHQNRNPSFDMTKKAGVFFRDFSAKEMD